MGKTPELSAACRVKFADATGPSIHDGGTGPAHRSNQEDRSMKTWIGYVGVCAVLAVAAPGLAGTWSGKEITKDGAIHVMNPAAPVDGATSLAPPELWRVGGDDDEDIIFGVLRDIAIDRTGNVYLLDVQLNQVMVFDREGAFLRTIGREGEGPGEFRRPSSFFITPEGKIAVVQAMPGKIVLLNPDGTPAGEFKTPDAGDGGMRMFWAAGSAGNSVVLGTNEFSQHDGAFHYAARFLLLDTSGKSRTILHEKSGKRDMANMGFDEKESFRLTWASGSDGRVYIAPDFDAYTIHCYGPSGALERVIEREYAHRDRSKKEMEENKPRIMFRNDRGTQRPKVTASPTDADVLRMFARDDGTLWVISSHGGLDKATGTVATVDVFDRNGRFVQQIALKADGTFRDDGVLVVGDHMFVLKELRAAQRAMAGGDEEQKAEEEDAEPMSVVCYRLSPTAAAKR
jgi:6-bladed beta-propeller